MKQTFMRRAAVVAVLCGSAALHADPLHPLANDAYWHHESNFIFPAKLGEFTRAGAPQELDGSSTVVAYYARGDGDARQLVKIEVFPIADGSKDPSSNDQAATDGEIIRTLDHAGWRVVVHAPKSDDAASRKLDDVVRALAVDRLGATDTRCPNAGCGT